jgi:hypothetical protein
MLTIALCFLFYLASFPYSLGGQLPDKQDKFDAPAFRDDIIEGLVQCDDITAASEFIETNARAPDYRMYEAQLFDIIVAGGLLAPGGRIETDGAELNKYSCFETENDHDALFKQSEIIQKLVRRYKFLQPSLEESFERFAKCLNGFDQENIPKLAQSAAFLMSMGLISAKPLLGMIIESIVEAGFAEMFLITFLQAYRKVGSAGQIGSTLRKSGMDQKLDLFFPQNNRTVSEIVEKFTAAGGLEDVIAWFLSQQTAELKQQLTFELTEMMKAGDTQEVLITKVRDIQVENRIPESEIIKLVFTCMMESIEWNKKAELMMGQACGHVHSNLALLARWAKSERAQITLMIAFQEYAFINQTLIKVFKRVILLLYRAEVLDEDSILLWFNHDHSQKGKTAFLTEMTEMVDWLNTADVEE